MPVHLESLYVLLVYILHAKENWAKLCRNKQQSRLEVPKGVSVTWSLCFNFLICKMSAIIFTLHFAVGIREPNDCEERIEISLNICPQLIVKNFWPRDTI